MSNSEGKIYSCELQAARYQQVAQRSMRRYLPPIGPLARVIRRSAESDRPASGSDQEDQNFVYCQRNEDLRLLCDTGDQVIFAIQTVQDAVDVYRPFLEHLSHRAPKYGGTPGNLTVYPIHGDTVILAGTIDFPHEHPHAQTEGLSCIALPEPISM